MAEKRAKRAEAFVAPAETSAPTVEEKRKRKRTEQPTVAEASPEPTEKPRKKRKHKEKTGDDWLFLS